MRSANAKASHVYALGPGIDGHHTPDDQPTRPLFRIAVIENFFDLLAAYGESTADAVVNEVVRRFRGVEIDGIKEIQVDVVRSSLFIGLTINTSKDVDAVVVDEAILVSAASRPVVANGERIVPRISLGNVGDVGQTLGGSREQVFTGSSPAAHGGYANLMACVVRCHDALNSGHVGLFAQPIMSGEGGRILYRECLARKSDPITGEVQERPSDFIPALERTGMTRWFDRAIVRKTIDLLRMDESSCLGCNISALSAINDAWWASTLAILEENPALASRLVIELTETAECPNMDAAIEFCEVFREQGCKVAVDDFGAGFSSIGFSLRVKPDIVKIDSNVVRELRSSNGSTVLKDMLVFLSNVAPQVVVEGIETEDDRKLAMDSGACWLQGFRMAPVTATRHDHAWLNPGYPLLLSLLKDIDQVQSIASTPSARLVEIIALAKDLIEDRSIGLSASHSQFIFERYSGELHRGISGLDQLRVGRRRPASSLRKGLDESFLASVDAIAKQHGAALRLLWIRSRVPESEP
jgi:EAL domain-containing protein (putative c-di-GMP-specific phosphodiesterase class I)